MQHRNLIPSSLLTRSPALRQSTTPRKPPIPIPIPITLCQHRHQYRYSYGSQHTRILPNTRFLSTLPNLPLFRALQDHDKANVAVVHSATARAFTYGNLVADVLEAKERLLSTVAAAGEGGGLEGERVGFLVENSYDYVVTLLSILANNAIALPISPTFPIEEMKYVMNNSQAKVLVATERFAEKASELSKAGLDREPVLVVKRETTLPGGAGVGPGEVKFEEIADKGGMMLYTSGTTNRPKGVLLPHSVLNAQASTLIEAWKYSPQDRLLHLLPLHHIHGTVNAILTPILAGSSIEFMFPFNPASVWNRLAAPFLPQSATKDKITFLTAVPTIYTRLMSRFTGQPPETQEAARKAISPENLRLNISGSAALPSPTKKAWQELSNGNVLLERYGMTEIGMAISCGLDFADRVDGSVGWALPSVEVRLVEEETGEIIEEGREFNRREGRDRIGEIQVRGPTVFREYWGNRKATSKAFAKDDDGKGKWFKTGDIATRRRIPEAGSGTSGDWAMGSMYFIQGRQSVDIIKTGGEKVSALEVERELLSLPQITEAAVVGPPSELWGQKVVAIVVLDKEVAAKTGRNGKPWNAWDMRRALKGRLAGYKIPVEMKVLEGGVPRNAMGKVNKKQLMKDVLGC